MIRVCKPIGDDLDDDWPGSALLYNYHIVHLVHVRQFQVEKSSLCYSENMRHFQVENSTLCYLENIRQFQIENSTLCYSENRQF